MVQCQKLTETNYRYSGVVRGGRLVGSNLPIRIEAVFFHGRKVSVNKGIRYETIVCI